MVLPYLCSSMSPYSYPIWIRRLSFLNVLKVKSVESCLAMFLRMSRMIRFAMTSVIWCLFILICFMRARYFFNSVYKIHFISHFRNPTRFDDIVFLLQHCTSWFSLMCHWRATRVNCRNLGDWRYHSILLEKHLFMHQSTQSFKQTYKMEAVAHNGKFC